MCRICEDFNAEMSVENRMQGIRNLFEVKEMIGPEHAREVVAMLNVNIDYDKDNLDGRILQAVKEFVTPEEPAPIDRSQL